MQESLTGATYFHGLYPAQMHHLYEI